MTALSVSDRKKIWVGLMRYWSKLPSGDADKSVSASKFELYNPGTDTGCIADMDNWLDTHSGNTSADTVGANGAINASYRSKFTVGQKGLIVMAVAAMRTGNAAVLQGALGVEVT